MNERLVIFTDLDGTLLDLETYSFHAAEEALRRVLARDIPLIFCSSKTRAEQEEYQKQMGFRAPMIVENGAAIVIPAGSFPCMRPDRDEVIEIGAPATVIRAELLRVREERNLEFRGYAELSLEELRDWTGLAIEDAARAKRREYSETLVGGLTADGVAMLNEAMRASGLVAVRGSRFYTVTSSRSDKGTAVARLTDLFRQRFGNVIAIGLGDGANDLPLLKAVDRAFLFQPSDVDRVVPAATGLEIVRGGGAATWNAVVNLLLDQYPD
ncbi:MAG: HAD-IIB family hydrolase [Blastocatellia bacterium]